MCAVYQPGDEPGTWSPINYAISSPDTTLVTNTNDMSDEQRRVMALNKALEIAESNQRDTSLEEYKKIVQFIYDFLK